MTGLNILPDTPHDSAFLQTKAFLSEIGIAIAETDDQRPWGGFFVIDSASEDAFINYFFPEMDSNELRKYGAGLRPKIVLVQPGKKLSWQYHNRRAEVWKSLAGPVGVFTSKNDTIPSQHEILRINEIATHGKQIRHRLIGLDEWGIVAEIWQHTESNNPSSEADIVRVEDVYGRQ